MRNTLCALGGLAALAAMLAVPTVRATDSCGDAHETFSADCDGWVAGGSYGSHEGDGPFCILATVILKDGDGNEVEVQTQELTLPEATHAGECFPEPGLGGAWASAPLSGNGFEAVIWEEWRRGTCDAPGDFIRMFDIHGEPFDCVTPICGDGNLDPGEECDDGNNEDGDGCSADCLVEREGCRVTGGGVDCFDGMFNEECSGATGKMKKVQGFDTYQCGGQAGAPTGAQPQPFGEWTHHQQGGANGSFIFHAGTASAPPGTEIDFIECSDPGWCDPAREAPFKQIDFHGTGSFKNMKDSPLEADVIPGDTLHCFWVHIEDLGEPGKSGKQGPSSGCPEEGFAGVVGDCDCPDYYRITIHATTDCNSPVIYEVFGFITGGNFQIHPPIN